MSLKSEIVPIAALEIDEVFSLLETRPEGLTSPEVEKRQLLYGKNQLPKTVTISLWRLLYQQFTHFMALLLWVAGSLAFVVNGSTPLFWSIVSISSHTVA